MVTVQRDHRPTGRNLVAHHFDSEALPQSDELHLRGDLTSTGVSKLGHGAPTHGTARATTRTREDGVKVAFVAPPAPVVLWARRPPDVFFGVAALYDPAVPKGRQAPAHIWGKARIGVRPAGVVKDNRIPAGQHHFAHRNPNIGSRADQIGLTAPSVGPFRPARSTPSSDRGRTCIRNSHQLSLRRHYPDRFIRSTALAVLSARLERTPDQSSPYYTRAPPPHTDDTRAPPDSQLGAARTWFTRGRDDSGASDPSPSYPVDHRLLLAEACPLTTRALATEGALDRRLRGVCRPGRESCPF